LLKIEDRAPALDLQNLPLLCGCAILRRTCTRRCTILLLSAHFHGIEFAKGATMEQQDGDLAFFVRLIAGAVVGGVAAALLAPRSGLETREQIVDRGLELKSRADDVVDRAQRVASDTVAKVQSAAQDILGQAHSNGSEA
jgi:hypothetical protein